MNFEWHPAIQQELEWIHRELAGQRERDRLILCRLDRIAQLLTGPGPAVLVLTVDPTTFDQAAPEGPGTPTIMKGSSAVQLTDTQQVTLSVAEQDSKGEPVTGDTLAWTVDQSGVIAITPSADTQSCLCVAGAPGTATVTVTDNSVTPPLTGTEAFTVVSGAATALVINAGTPEAQPAPAAPPAPAPAG